ncbi:MAG: hypothetical protein R3Y51_00110 [Rikenellaceae bacterium]
MTKEEINYVNELIFATLAQYKSIHIDNFGSLKCVLKPTNKNYSQSVNEAPKYEVFYTKDVIGDSISKFIIEKTDCAPKEAKEIVAEWLTDIKNEADEKAFYEISGVGVIVDKGEDKKVFICDKKMLSILEPVTIKGIKTNTTPTVAADTVKPNTSKKNLKGIFIIAGVLILALGLYFIAPRLFCNQNSEYVAVIDTVKIDEAKEAEEALAIERAAKEKEEKEKAERELAEKNAKKEGYYVIVSTFKIKENAEKELAKMTKIEKNAQLLEVPEHGVTPYFISIDKYNTYEEARIRMNNSTYQNTWVYHFQN